MTTAIARVKGVLQRARRHTENLRTTVGVIIDILVNVAKGKVHIMKADYQINLNFIPLVTAQIQQHLYQRILPHLSLDITHPDKGQIMLPAILANKFPSRDQ